VSEPHLENATHLVIASLVFHVFSLAWPGPGELLEDGFRKGVHSIVEAVYQPHDDTGDQGDLLYYKFSLSIHHVVECGVLLAHSTIP
jgi:hypothetical protein